MSDLLTLDAAAEYLHLRPKTLLNKKSNRMGPKCVKIGRSLYYQKADLDAWIEQVQLTYSPSVIG